MIKGYDKETLTAIFSSRRAKIRESLSDSITALPVVFSEVCDDGTILFTLTPERWMRNPGGVMHGGIICTAFDNAMGTVTAALNGKMTPTVNMQVDFVRPVVLDRPAVIRVETVSMGKTLSRLRATLWQDSEDTPCATGAALYYVK